LKVISTIGKHGQAVIVGRGANFILPPDEKFSVRVVAPLEVRIQNVTGWHNVSIEKAKQRVIQRESKRRAFIRQSFNADISDPNNYDLIINTNRMGIESAVEAVIGPVMTALGNKT
jgi:cytidylate kinase